MSYSFPGFLCRVLNDFHLEAQTLENGFSISGLLFPQESLKNDIPKGSRIIVHHFSRGELLVMGYSKLA